MAAAPSPLKRARMGADAYAKTDAETIADLRREMAALTQQVNAGERQRLAMLVMLDRYLKSDAGGASYQYTAKFKLSTFVPEDDDGYERRECDCESCVERDEHNYDEFGRQESFESEYFPTVDTCVELVTKVIPRIDSCSIADQMDGNAKASMVAWLRTEPWKNFGGQAYKCGERAVSWQWDTDKVLSAVVDSDGEYDEPEYAELERLVFQLDLVQIRGSRKTRTEFRRDFSYNGNGVSA